MEKEAGIEKGQGRGIKRGRSQERGGGCSKRRCTKRGLRQRCRKKLGDR